MKPGQDLSWLVDQRGRRDGNGPKLHCPDTLSFYNSQQEFLTPEVQINCIKEPNEIIKITLDPEAENSDSLMSLRLPYEFKSINASKFLHDFTYSCLSGSSDKNLSDIHRLNNEDDTLTPGDIIETDNFFLVIIYTTNRLDIDEDGARRLFKNKKMAYYSQLKERTVKKDIYLFIIITTPSSVVINTSQMPQNVVEELISRYCFSIAVGEKIEEKYKINVLGTKNKRAHHREYEEIFDSLKYEHLSPKTYFTEKVILNCTRPVTQHDLRETEKHIQRAIELAERTVNRELTNDKKVDPIFIKQKRLKEIDEIWKNICDHRQHELKNIAHKCVVQLPYVNLKLSNSIERSQDTTDDISSWKIGESINDNPTHFLIKQSIFYLQQGLPPPTKPNLRTNKKRVNCGRNNKPNPEDVEAQLKSHWITYKRVVPEIPEIVAEKLATWGVDREKYEKISKIYQEAEEERAKTYSLHTDTTDISNWLTSKEHFEMTDDIYLEDEISSAVALAEKAIDKSSNNTDDKKFARKKLKRILSSRIGRWSKLMSDVGDTLSITLNQEVSEGEWILKKLKNYNMYLLIKPIANAEHLFFTMFWKNEDELFSRGKDSDECFVTKNIHTDGVISWIDIASQNTSKLVNLVKMESQLICNAVFECENFETAFMRKEDLFVAESNEKISCARQSFLLSVLVMMNDKFRLDELMSQARYMVMEGFKPLPYVPNPGKMMNKLRRLYRNRMEVWCANRLVETSRRIVDNFGFRCVKNDEEEVEWVGLFDPFLHIPLKNPTQIINSIYYNYCKNKDEQAQGNSSAQMLTKILTYENKLPRTKDYLGTYSRRDCRYDVHEFSPEVVRVMTSKLADKLRAKLGPSWQTVLKEETFNDLDEQDLEAISTLKASAGFSETGDRKYCRPRVAEAIKELWDESGQTGWKAMHLLRPALKKAKNAGGLHIDLFRKNQHGGLREVYVMSVSSRIIQLVLERIARTLCKQFNSEIITHPSKKLTTPADHSEREKKMQRGLGANITVCTSDDASKWNQGHFVTKFAIMLCQLTDPLFHPFIINGLDLWTRKKILLPSSVLKKFDYLINNDAMNCDLDGDEYLKRIFDCYRGIRIEKWMKPGTNYIETATGMMQGVLHLTSSLYHTMIQEFMRDQIQSRLKTTYPGIDSVVTVMQSSDDSGMIVSVSTDGDEDAIKKMLSITTMFYTKHEIGKMIGIYPSEKCTVGTINMYEFNSEYFIWGSSVRPTRKWVYAATSIVEVDSLYARQESSYNLISEILEGGGSSITAWFCQISQAMLHYRMLGCSVSPLWPKYATKLSKRLDPTIGFYYIDNPRYCGLTSMRFGLWFLSEKSYSLSRKLRIILNTTAQKRLEDKEYQTDLQDIFGVLCAAVVADSSQLNDTNQKRWTNIVKNLKLDPQWLEKVGNCPSILYQQAKNADEFDLRLAVKMHSPGISSSLARGNCVSRMITSSLAILSKIVGKRPNHNDKNNDTSPHVNKTYYSDEEELSEEEKNILFPLRCGYESLVSLAHKFDLTGTIDPTITKKKRFDLIVFSSPVPNDYSLEKLVAWKWFNLEMPASRADSQIMFEEYKANIKWLKDTPEETLIESPFVNHVQMQTYFARTEITDRVAHLNAAPVIGVKGKSALSAVLSQNMWPHWCPKQRGGLKTIQAGPDTLRVLSQGIFMTAVSGMQENDINKIVHSLLKESEPLVAPGLKTHRSAWTSLYLMQNLAVKISSHNVEIKKSDVKSESQQTLTTWIRECSKHETGCFGTFAVSQQLDNDKKRGQFIWSGIMDQCLIQIHGDSYGEINTCVTKVIVNDSEKLREAWPLFKQWVEDHNAVLDFPRRYQVTEGETLVARISKSRLCRQIRNTMVGIPIVMSQQVTLTEMEESWAADASAIIIQADSEAVRVRLQMTADGTDNPSTFLTVLSCPLAFLDKSVTTLPVTTFNFVKDAPDFWRNFVTLQPLSDNQVDSILDIFTKNKTPKIKQLGFKNIEQLREKIMESFQYCLDKFGDKQEQQQRVKINASYDLNANYLSVQESKQQPESSNQNGIISNFEIKDLLYRDQDIPDDLYCQALEEDLKLYRSEHNNILNVLQIVTINSGLDRAANIPRPLMSTWIEQKLMGRMNSLNNLIVDHINDGKLNDVIDQLMVLTGLDPTQLRYTSIFDTISGLKNLVQE